MKGNEIKKTIYEELVRLDYSRKENDLISVNSVNWFELEDELVSVILTFPSRHVKFDVDLMDIEDLSGEQQFYIFHSNGNTYLVDTQGYTYPRYVVELNGFTEEVESEYERIEGLTRISDVIIIEQALKSIVIDLAQEGFDQEQVQAYLDVKLEYMIKEAVATNVKSFQ
jgi:hypothetical protein